MMVAEKFVFIHMHKTGGQFILRALSDYIPTCRPVGYHYPRRLLPAQYASLPVFGFVRNPWDWYVSWYHFNSPRPTINPLFRVMSNDGQYGFNKTIRNMLSFGSDTMEARARIRQLARYLPESMEGNRGIGLTKDCLRHADGSFYTWQFKRMFTSDSGELDSVLFGKMEHLRDEFVRILCQMNVNISTQLHNYVRTASPVNTSERGNYQQYYDDELKELVRENDILFVNKFGYQF